MDKNKLQVLRDIGYEVQKACGLCKHGSFNFSNLFGTCVAKEYGHGKHTGPARNLSISRYGSCQDFEYNEQYDVMLHGFRQLLNID